MPTLTLKFKDKPICEYQLQKGLSLTIGRRKNNGIVIDNLAVSGHHAKIDSVGDEFVLIDLQSKNGSFVNEKIINSHWLRHGDVISIGKHCLVFKYAEDEPIPDDDLDKIEQTMVMDTSQYRTMMEKSKPDVPRPFAGYPDSGVTGEVVFLSGGSGDIKLTQSITKIGKHPESDIIIKGLWVGKTAVTISKRPDGFYLSYVGGMAKPRVNDKPVSRATILNDLDVIEIGSTKMQFHEHNIEKTKILKIRKPTGKKPVDAVKA
jgi:pSer/pThr/pTyr-binding forkhead associated (FHA) protein